MKNPGPQVLVLNGGSSSGKTTLARALQELLDGYWLRLGVDTLIDAAPPKLIGGSGLVLGEDGQVNVEADFAEVERQWMAGVAAMAVAGASVLVEDNFVSGLGAQQRWNQALSGLVVGWIGVRCAPDIASARERSRGDRIRGMAASQAESVHAGIGYDLVVDTGGAAPDALSEVVRAHFWNAGSQSRLSR